MSGDTIVFGYIYKCVVVCADIYTENEKEKVFFTGKMTQAIVVSVIVIECVNE